MENEPALLSKEISEIIIQVKRELIFQRGKWGEQNHSPEIWMLILGEEFGEAQKDVLEFICPNSQKLDGDWINEYRKELIQVAAVAISAIESLDKNTSPMLKARKDGQ